MIRTSLRSSRIAGVRGYGRCGGSHCRRRRHVVGVALMKGISPIIWVSCRRRRRHRSRIGWNASTAQIAAYAVGSAIGQLQEWHLVKIRSSNTLFQSIQTLDFLLTSPRKNGFVKRHPFLLLFHKLQQEMNCCYSCKGTDWPAKFIDLPLRQPTTSPNDCFHFVREKKGYFEWISKGLSICEYDRDIWLLTVLQSVT
jgi:hypothetical protein